MPATAAARLKEIRDFALSLPDTQPKSPWPGHDDVAVNDKTFVYLGLRDGEVSVGVKLPVNRAAVLALPKSKPMGYGLGKSGWVSIRFEPPEGPPRDTIKRWVMESYRVQAPKRLLRALEEGTTLGRRGRVAALIGEPQASCAAHMPPSTATISAKPQSEIREAVSREATSLCSPSTPTTSSALVDK